jgi:hypothetical protein
MLPAHNERIMYPVFHELPSGKVTGHPINGKYDYRLIDVNRGTRLDGPDFVIIICRHPEAQVVAGIDVKTTGKKLAW